MPEQYFPPLPARTMDFDNLLRWLQHQTISVQKLTGGTIQAVSITLASGGTIESSNFVTGTSGWQITGDGNIEVNNAIIRGSIINIPSGASFPVSPAPVDGDLFYRTDQNISYRYDGPGAAWIPIDYISSGARIANAIIGNAHITDLNASKIDTGFLSAERIQVETLTVSKLIIGSLDNLITDPGFESTTLDQYLVVQGGGTWANVTTTPRSGGRCLEYDPSGQIAGAILLHSPGGLAISNPVGKTKCGEGDAFYFEAWVRASATPANDAKLRISYRDENGTNLLSVVGAAVTPTTSYQKLTTAGVAPAGTAYVTFDYQIENDGNSALVRFDDGYARRQVTTGIIEDLAVDTAQLNTNAATAAKINDYDPADANSGTFSGQTFRAVNSNGLAFSSATTSGVKIDSTNVILQRSGATRIIGFSTAVRSGDQFDPQVNNIGGLGQSGLEWTDVWATDTSINTSDPSLKSQLGPSPLGLDFLKRLTPSQWKWTDLFDRAEYERIINEEYEPLTEEFNQKILEAEAAENEERKAAKYGDQIDRGAARLRGQAEGLRAQMEATRTRALAVRRPGSRFHHGLDASQVKQALDDEGISTQDFAGYIQDTQTGMQHLRLGEFTAPIINAIKELDARLTAAGL